MIIDRRILVNGKPPTGQLVIESEFVDYTDALAIEDTDCKVFISGKQVNVKEVVLMPGEVINIVLKD